ncbi:hypothetical protein BGX26_000171 [Mortierella sp. AD094]|nr:hypothetical protein BGX26_000171 [Mortierella sp. AD094]
MIPLKLSSYNIKEKAKADAVDFNTAQTMVIPNTDVQKFKVQSFAIVDNPRTINRVTSDTYDVRTDEEFAIIAACRCDYYAQHQAPCKHIYLTAKAYKGMEISCQGEPYEIGHLQVQADQNDFDPSPDSTLPLSLEQTLPPAILLLLHRQRARKAEQKRIAREKEQEQELQDLEADLKDMISEIVIAAGSTKKRKCTLEYSQTTVAGPSNMQHVAWANEIREVDGKLKEHVSFHSFVRRFGFTSKEEAMSQYERLLRSSRLNKKRRERLKAAYDEFVKTRLDSFWWSWDWEQASHEFDASCDIVVKRTAILAQRESLAVTARGFSAVQTDSKTILDAQANLDRRRELALRRFDSITASAKNLGKQLVISVAAVEGFFQQILERLGLIDIVVNNAGVILKKNMADITKEEEEVDSTFATNTKAPFFIMREAAKHLADEGRVINVGTALQGLMVGHYSAYAGCKASLDMFTRALAKEIGARGITVSSVAPDPLETPQTTAFLSSLAPLNLSATLTILCLSSSSSSPAFRWVNSQTLFVNGGVTAR